MRRGEETYCNSPAYTWPRYTIHIIHSSTTFITAQGQDGLEATTAVSHCVLTILMKFKTDSFVPTTLQGRNVCCILLELLFPSRPYVETEVAKNPRLHTYTHKHTHALYYCMPQSHVVAPVPSSSFAIECRTKLSYEDRH